MNQPDTGTWAVYGNSKCDGLPQGRAHDARTRSNAKVRGRTRTNQVGSSPPGEGPRGPGGGACCCLLPAGRWYGLAGLTRVQCQEKGQGPSRHRTVRPRALAVQVEERPVRLRRGPLNSRGRARFSAQDSTVDVT